MTAAIAVASPTAGRRRHASDPPDGRQPAQATTDRSVQRGRIVLVGSQEGGAAAAQGDPSTAATPGKPGAEVRREHARDGEVAGDKPGPVPEDCARAATERRGLII
jgi:hypothetical protein